MNIGVSSIGKRIDLLKKYNQMKDYYPKSDLSDLLEKQFPFNEPASIGDILTKYIFPFLEDNLGKNLLNDFRSIIYFKSGIRI